MTTGSIILLGVLIGIISGALAQKSVDLGKLSDLKSRNANLYGELVSRDARIDSLESMHSEEKLRRILAEKSFHNISDLYFSLKDGKSKRVFAETFKKDILRYHHDGKTNVEIARIVKLDQSTICKNLKKWLA